MNSGAVIMVYTFGLSTEDMRGPKASYPQLIPWPWEVSRPTSLSLNFPSNKHPNRQVGEHFIAYSYANTDAIGTYFYIFQ